MKKTIIPLALIFGLYSSIFSQTKTMPSTSHRFGFFHLCNDGKIAIETKSKTPDIKVYDFSVKGEFDVPEISSDVHSTSPVISDDGKLLFFNQNSYLYVYNFSTQMPAVLSSRENPKSYPLVCFNNVLTYVSDNGKGKQSIVERDLESGLEKKILTNQSSIKRNFKPATSDNGRYIVIHSSFINKTNEGLYLLDKQNLSFPSKISNLKLNEGLEDLWCDVSNTGDVIYVTNTNYDHLFLVKKGESPVQLTKKSFDGDSPRISSDGEYVVYLSNGKYKQKSGWSFNDNATGWEYNTRDVHIIKTKSGKSKRLKAAGVSQVEISPDGEHIVYYTIGQLNYTANPFIKDKKVKKQKREIVKF